MRIIGGTAGGRILKAPKGLAVRPTPDLVRQALFNSLAARVEGTRVLELFGGTGALSLECLSRGAASAVVVESSHRHGSILRLNAEAVGFGAEKLEVRIQDAFAALHQLAASRQKFDLILADPPYGEKNGPTRRSLSLAQRLLDEAALPAVLAPGGLLALGHARRDTLSLPVSWEERKLLKHGDSIFRILRSLT